MYCAMARPRARYARGPRLAPHVIGGAGTVELDNGHAAVSKPGHRRLALLAEGRDPGKTSRG